VLVQINSGKSLRIRVWKDKSKKGLKKGMKKAEKYLKERENLVKRLKKHKTPKKA
jgi:hypothetical protein